MRMGNRHWKVAAGLMAGLLVLTALPVAAPLGTALQVDAKGTATLTVDDIVSRFAFDETASEGNLAKDHYHWDAAKKTLTLENFAMEDDTAVWGSLMRLPGDSTVILKGNNTLAESAVMGSCISANGPLTIKGNGSLKAVSSSCAILAVNENVKEADAITYDVKIEDCTLDLEAYGQGSFPLNGDNIQISNAKLTLKGNRSAIAAIGSIGIDHSKLEVNCIYDAQDLEHVVTTGSSWGVITGVHVALDHVDLHLTGDHARILADEDMVIYQSKIVDDSTDYRGELLAQNNLKIAGSTYVSKSADMNGIMGARSLTIQGSKIDLTSDPEYGGITGLYSYGNVVVENSTVAAENYQAGAFSSMSTLMKNSTLNFKYLASAAFRNACGSIEAENCKITTDTGLCAFLAEGRDPETIIEKLPHTAFMRDIPNANAGQVILKNTKVVSTNTEEAVFLSKGGVTLDGCKVTAPAGAAAGEITTTANPQIGPVTFRTLLVNGVPVRDLSIK